MPLTGLHSLLRVIYTLQDEVEFTEAEILALQLLYLMIDRDNSNGIDSAELIAWSTTEGSFIGPDDAQLCIDRFVFTFFLQPKSVIVGGA